LTSAGAGAVPSFAAAGGGDFVKLAGGVDITSDSNLHGYYTSDYVNYKWMFNGVSSSGVSEIRLRFYKSSGAISSSKYVWQVGKGSRTSSSSNFANADGAFNADHIQLNNENVSSNAGLGATIVIDIYDPKSANRKMVGWDLWTEIHDGSKFLRYFGSGRLEDSDEMTGINIYSNSGNFGAQHWSLYGMKST